MYGKDMTNRKRPDTLKYLWESKFFEKERTFSEIKKELSTRLGCNPSSQNLQMSLLRSKSYLTRKGSRGKYRYIQKYHSKNIALDDSVMPDRLIKALGRDFDTDIADLKLNFGRSGTCTAFLLRKILEKLILLTFMKNGLGDKLKDPNGGIVNLTTMLSLATNNKVKGEHFLTPKTAKEIGGVKFLGDTSAHNPLVNVDMKTVLLAMPFIITGYEELSRKI